MSKKRTDSVDLERQISALGLNVSDVARHAELLRDAVRTNSRPNFPIVDTCRFANGGILAVDAFLTDVPPTSAAGFVAFVPSAGAASRYSQPLFQIVSALEALDESDGDAAKDAYAAIRRSLSEMRQSGALDWPLPPRLRQLVNAPDLVESLGRGDREALLADLQLPKALLPCVSDGASFLQMKLREHAALKGLDGQVFIAPVGKQSLFTTSVGGAAPRSVIIEQGPSLSTLRFTPQIDPVVDEAGNLSPVPAGHGALAQLFPLVGQEFSGSHSLFIRNIDNVMGIKSDAQQATYNFLATHRVLLEGVRCIRRALAASDTKHAAEVARSLLASAPAANAYFAGNAIAGDANGSDLGPLWELQIRLFHHAPDDRLMKADRQIQLGQLTALYERPVNTLGQVPNTGKDIGGTPCFVKSPDGSIAKLCIEVPHASEADKRDFLANAAKATHFNPVFAAAEITNDPGYYNARNEACWLLSEKVHRGQRVVYFETVLYELLGNSRLANCVFVEVPRLVFHPHKTLQDGVAKSLADWT